MGMHVVELFAGVGGFRLGLERASSDYEFVWFNQWEPSVRAQHAYECYTRRFDGGLRPDLSNEDIGKVPADRVPDHDLLVGGFPCQDYSVAATLDKSKGLQGKKGVLWWEIRRILKAKRPAYVVLENVDRLLRSPAKQRGRDFGVLLACMRDLGYLVEWRVINAADYGFPQKRRRVFIFAVRTDTVLGRTLASAAAEPTYLTRNGFFAPEFPVKADGVAETSVRPPDVELPKDIHALSESFDFHFQNAGVMHAGCVWTRKLVPAGTEPVAPMRNVLQPCEDERFYIPESHIEGKKGWKYFRSAKNELRESKSGHVYRYTEGKMAWPDPVDQPSRTLLTGEGGTAPSRSKHAVADPGNGRIRTLTPEECEALNGFPSGHTSGMPERWRYFAMGNALVVGVVERIGRRLHTLVGTSPQEQVHQAGVVASREKAAQK